MRINSQGVGETHGNRMTYLTKRATEVCFPLALSIGATDAVLQPQVSQKERGSASSSRTEILDANTDFQVTMYCKLHGQHLPLWTCFKGEHTNTYLELKRNGQTRVYDFHELASNSELASGSFSVPNSFELTAQNASEYVLGISISNSNGSEVYQDEVGEFKVIKVGN